MYTHVYIRQTNIFVVVPKFPKLIFATIIVNNFHLLKLNQLLISGTQTLPRREN